MNYAAFVVVLAIGNVALGQPVPAVAEATTILTDDQAEQFARHPGLLSLYGLGSLSDDQAAALAKHEGHLRLNHVRTLSDKAAAALARHEGPLYLDGVRALSPDAAASLRANPRVDLADRFRR